MPHGITLLFFLNGKPISPHNRLLFSLSKHPKLSIEILYIESGDNPEVYELIKINFGLSDNIFLQAISKSHKSFSNFHTSPEAPLPKDGGSIIIPSYFLLRLSSLCIYFIQSSIINLTFPSGTFDNCIFSLHQLTLPFDASTWHTFAPAKAAETVAAPVYPKRLITFAAFFSFIISAIQSQFAACSGKSPVCLNPVGCTFNTILL